jgi:hypothetical protein
MVDNPSSRSTDITVANNPSSAENEGGKEWLKTGFVTSVGGEALDLGTQQSTDGSATWFDAGSSDLSIGKIFFAEDGLYRVQLRTLFAGDAPFTFDNEDLFSVVCIASRFLTRIYSVYRPVYEILKEPGGSQQWGADLSLTDVFQAGDNVEFNKYASDQCRSRTMDITTTIRKIV